MVRTRDLAIAAGFALVIIVGSPFVGQIRAAVAAAFPGAYSAIIGGMVAAAIAIAILIAIVRIRGPQRGSRAGDPVRERRALRYLALAAALAAGAVWARIFGTGDASVDVVERFHFVEYGLLTLLFYVAWYPLADGAALVLPVLAGVLAGILDEWFQWFVPLRVGELHDVGINGVAVACGLLFSIAFRPPARFTLVLGRDSSQRVGIMAALVLLVLALFVHSVYLGYDIRDPQIGVFRSRYTRAELESAARQRSVRWREEPPLAVRLLSREDQYMTEALWHVVRRNEAVSAADLVTAWRENLILETFYAPVLDTPSYLTPGSSRWPAAQRANAARQAEGDRQPYVSGAGPYRLYTWSKPLFWTAIALALVMVIFLSAGRPQQPQG